MHTRNQLRAGLLALGILPGDTVLMHASYKSLGGIEGGAAGFFETFLDLLGPKGTLILPALSYAWVCESQPVFDVRATPVCPGIGFLPEFFRTRIPGVVRSLHPTHSCCMTGHYAKELAADHELDNTPVGPRSPFAKLPRMDGKILMLGCSADRNTSMHGVEETAEPPYLLDRTHPVPYVLIDAHGQRHDRPAYAHSFHGDGFIYEQRYFRVLDLLDRNEARRGSVLDADCILMSARAVWAKGRQALLRDPFFFVDRISVDSN